MSYVITDHNQQGFVLLGPVDWKPRYISNIIYDEYGEEITVNYADEQRVPYDILPNVKVRKCITSYDRINPKIEYLNGPTWTYYDDNTEYQAVASWVKADKNVDLVKNELKAEAARIRWNKENRGTSITVQDISVWCDTSRNNRGIYSQKYSTMNDGDILKWKFGNTWIEISKSDLKLVMDGVNSYIQACFDWESNISSQIDACDSLSDLNNISIADDNINSNSSAIAGI